MRVLAGNHNNYQRTCEDEVNMAKNKDNTNTTTCIEREGEGEGEGEGGREGVQYILTRLQVIKFPLASTAGGVTGCHSPPLSKLITVAP